MPSNPLDPSTPTFYLDQSTLSAAYRANAIGDPGSVEAFYPLLPWIERVASKANLCISLYHLFEIADWQDIETATRFARWLDGLPTVWTYSLPRVEAREDEYWLKVAFARSPTAPVEPFAPSLLYSISDYFNPEQTPGLFQTIELPTLVEKLREQSDTQERRRNFIPDWALEIRGDRINARTQGAEQREIHKTTERKFRSYLRKRACNAHHRVAHELPQTATWGSVQDPFVELWQKHPKALPATRVIWQFISGVEQDAERRTPGSNTWRNEFSSAFADLAHAAIGAAYCDVFTCDARTSSRLQGLRENLGFNPPIVLRPDTVDQLMATWP